MDRHVRADGLAQALQIAGRIGQTVDVVDAQPVDPAFGDESHDGAVDVVEDGRLLDAHADEAGDLEEAPIGEMPPAFPPVEEPPGLRSVQPADQIAVLRQRVEARRQIGLPDRGADHAVQAVRDRGCRARRGVGDPGEGGGLEPIEDLPVARRRQRPAVFVIFEHEAPLGVGGDGEFAVRQACLEGSAEERQRHVAGLPVDVEVAGEGTRFAPFQDVRPPGVLHRGGHVVRARCRG